MSEGRADLDNIKSFWNNRAALGDTAGTDDLIARKLEVAAIGGYVENGMRVLDVGCGNGVTAIQLATRYAIDLVGFDFAHAMVAAAENRARETSLKGRTRFFVADARDLKPALGPFDVAYTERMLINLPDWSTQESVIRCILETVRVGGRYLMCENSMDGLERLNELRKVCGLSAISPPWHNRYLRDSQVERCRIPNATLEGVENLTSTYAFLSRVVNAWLAARAGTQPAYDAPVNKLALALPPIAKLGQTRLWVWRRDK